MCSKLFLLLLLLIVSNDFVFGKNGNKTKTLKTVIRNNVNNQKENKSRLKRCAGQGADKSTPDNDFMQYDHSFQDRGRTIKLRPIVDKESPFWGTRGRRESSSDETVPDVQLPANNHHKNSLKTQNLLKLVSSIDDKQRRDDVDSPFWGNRGRRTSDESEDNEIDVFWGNRGRRQDDEPFWGTRGRREEDSPFWGNRGRRDDDEPFWGNRGRREETEPFWGNRGRRETYEPFWGSRGKKKTKNRSINKDVIEPFWGNRAKLKELKKTILGAIEDVQDKINDLGKKKRDNVPLHFWMNKGRNSKLKYLFNGLTRNRMQFTQSDKEAEPTGKEYSKILEPNTLNDDRMYAEEPRYILVERSSRSSAEDDPFFISRGKKFNKFKLEEAVRDRRGAIEEIVKSVRNDPYYIARGKKDSDNIKIDNTTLQDQFIKAKELICSTIGLVTTNKNNKVKRQANDNERDRRTTLKKLALQLQMDPYFVSRGKKSVDIGKSDSLEQFINSVNDWCN